MSHFTVLVVTEDGTKESIAKALAPFEEYSGEDDFPKELLEFHDKEESVIAEYQQGSVEKVRLKDGRMFYRWDDRFKKDLSSRQEYPADSERVKVPHLDQYETLEEFAKGWYGYDGRDLEKGRYGYWENPDAKWDWWEIGGRWRGMFDGKDICRKDQAGDVETTFAVLKDGVWYERGKMGWWACVSEEKRPCEWEDQFRVLWEEIKGHELVALVDCHI